MKRAFIFLLFIVVSFQVRSQTFLDWQLHDRYFSIYAGTGWTGYVGDLTNGHPFTDGLSHINLGVEARLYSKLGARIQIAQYKLAGNDKFASDSTYNRQRNLSFQSKNYEWQLQGVYYFLKYRQKYHQRRTYEPYIAFGVGQTFYNPKTEYTDNTGATDTYTLRDIGTESESYKKFAWIVPVNIGVKAMLNEFLNLSLDIGYRYAFTKYLDDVSNVYGGPFADGTIQASLSNRKDEIDIINQEAYDAMVPGASRGNGNHDGYFLINLNIELYLPRDLFKSKNGKRRKEKILGKPSAYD